MTNRSSKTVRKTAEPGKSYTKTSDLRDATHAEALRQLAELWRSAGHEWTESVVETVQYILERAPGYKPWTVDLTDVALLAEYIKLKRKVDGFDRGKDAWARLQTTESEPNLQRLADELTITPWLLTSAMNELMRPAWGARLRQASAEIEARGLLEAEEDRTTEQRAWPEKQRKKQHGTRALVCDDNVLADLVPSGLEVTDRLRALLSLAFGGDFPEPERRENGTRRRTVASVIRAEDKIIRKRLKSLESEKISETTEWGGDTP